MTQAIFAVVVGGEEWVGHTHEVRLAAERVASATLAAKLARDTGASDAERAAALAAVEARVSALGDLVRDNPAQVARVAGLRSALRDRLGLSAGEATTSAGISDIAGRLAEVQAAEAELLARRADRVRVLRLLFFTGGVLMAALVGVVLWRQLRAASEQAAEGERGRRELEGLLAEKLRLLREVNHRVGNSLAMVGALLHVQAQASSGAAREALEEAWARVGAVGRVHKRFMNAAAVDTLDLAEHLPALCDEAGVSLGRPGQLAGQVRGSAVVPVETAVALSLLVNELATPALLGRDGRVAQPVRVSVGRQGPGLAVTVSDPEGLLPDAADGDEVRALILGALASQLGASLPEGDGRELTLLVTAS